MLVLVPLLDGGGGVGDPASATPGVVMSVLVVPSVDTPVATSGLLGGGVVDGGAPWSAPAPAVAATFLPVLLRVVVVLVVLVTVEFMVEGMVMGKPCSLHLRLTSRAWPCPCAALRSDTGSGSRPCSL